MPGGAPEVYRKLPSDAVLLEVPVSYVSALYRAVPRYQLAHGKQTIVASSVSSVADLPGVAFRNWLPTNPDKWLESRAKFLIVHLDPEKEERIFGPKEAWLKEQNVVDRSYMLKFANQLAIEWGAPLYTDGSLISVWDIKQARGFRNSRRSADENLRNARLGLVLK